MTKTCTLCRETKLLELFPKKPRGALGVDSRCKACRKVIDRGRYARRDSTKKEPRPARLGPFKPVEKFE